MEVSHLTLTSEHLSVLIQILNRIPTEYGRAPMNYIESLIRQEIQRSQNVSPTKSAPAGQETIID